MMIIYYIVAIISILTSLVNIPKIKSANTTSTRKVFALWWICFTSRSFIYH